MSTKRNYLPLGTRIQFAEGSIYEITGVPIGNGGGSVIYPADRIFQTKDGFSRDGIIYALKECYPLSEEHRFIRNHLGQIVPEIPDDGELTYLEKVQQMQLCEQQITQKIYRTASRLLPIRESARKILLTLPEKEPVTVENTVTVMESLTAKGGSLSSYIKEYRHLPPSQTFHIIQQVLFALREVHKEGYLHLDIQDGNIFIKGTLEDESDIATMIDFGSARLLHEGQTDVISDKVIFTTQGFSAPEILLHNDGSLQLGPEADIYSVGCLILYLLTGSRYDSNSLLNNTSGKYLTRFKLRNIHCPRHLIDRMQSIIAHALEKEPENRYHSVDEMLEDVTDFVKALQPYRSDLNAVTYDAFICYKHGDTDSTAATALQQHLEHFRLPKSVSRKRHPFQRVFVDEGELSSCADFGEQIRAALKNSGWLIVICSPDTPQSRWVNLEIDTFLEYHDRSRILAVLTDGTPNESFPKQLLGNEDGQNEVLAADARGKDLPEVLRKLKKEALLRIAAPMAGTTYDTLKQRRKLYVMQRLSVIIAICLLVAILFSVYAIRQNQKLQTEYRNNLIQQSRYLAKQAEEALNNNNPLKSIELSLNALPSETSDRPVVAEAEYTLTKALNVYTTPANALGTATATGIFQHNTNISRYDYFTDPESGILFTCDGQQIYLWDVETCTLLHTIAREESIHLFQSNMLFTDENLLIFADYNEICCYDYKQKKYLWTSSIDGLKNGMIPLSDGTQMIVITNDTLYLLDTSTGKLIRKDTFAYDNTTVNCNALQVSPDEKWLAFDVHIKSEKEVEEGYLLDDDYYYNNTNDGILLFNLEQYNFQILPLECGLIKDITFTEDNRLLVVGTRGYELHLGSNFRLFKRYQPKTTSLQLVDFTEDRTLWKQEFDFMIPDNLEHYIRIIDKANEPAVLFSFSNQCAVLDIRDGTILDIREFQDSVIAVWPNADGFIAITADGGRQVIEYQKDFWITHFPFSDGLDKCKYECGYFLNCYYSDSFSNYTITRYNYSLSDENWNCLSDEITMEPSKYYVKDGICAFADCYFSENSTLAYIDSRTSDSLREISLIQNDCGFSVKEIWGVCQREGKDTLLLYCQDNCENHSKDCVILTDMNTGNFIVHYFPLPEEHSFINGVSFTENTAYFTCTTSYMDKDQNYHTGFTLYSWNLLTLEMEDIAFYETSEGENNFIDTIVPSSDGSYLLLYNTAFDENGEQLGHTYIADASNKSIKKAADISIPYELRKDIIWNRDGSLFAAATEQEIIIFDQTGKEKLSLPYRQEATSLHSISFTPDHQSVLVLYENQNFAQLVRYKLSDGSVQASIDLKTETYGTYEYTWNYLSDGSLALSDQGYHTFLVDLSDSGLGLRTSIQNALGYDEATDQFYTFELNNGSKPQFGYFPHYSIEELIQKGQKILGN